MHFFKTSPKWVAILTVPPTLMELTYYESVPRDAYGKILWMESDRMGFFINTVKQGGLERVN